MQILIVGCGKVGYTLVEHLSKEEHNITVLDRNADRITKVTNDFDVMGQVGDGSSYNSLKEAGVENTDLLIAVTESDEKNLLCCLIARKAGGCKIIARVRNPIYSREIEFLKKEFGLAMIINPEYTAAMEVARIFRFPSAITIETFSKGKVELLHFRVKEGSILHNMKVMDIHARLRCNILVCMVKRDDEVQIPSGDFVLQEKDIVSIIAPHKKAGEFFKRIGVETKRVKNTMLIGGGRLTYYLAERLLRSGIDVKIIEQDAKRCQELSELLPKANIVLGDGTDKKLLQEEGIDEIEGFAALTDNDEENIMVTLFARKISKAKLVTKINRINFDEVIDELNLDSIVYPKFLTAQYILQYARSMQDSLESNVENLYKMDGGAEALEFYIKEKSPVVGVPLSQLQIRKNILVCCINRNGDIMMPTGHSTIEVGDTVIIMSKHSLFDIRDILGD
ncbi:MAG: Trk system potassium transporter TrkA [Lachnospiraceae bacterium]|jgi:trk system potassium uptake protein TrkA